MLYFLVHPTFECVIRIDVEAVAGVAEAGDAVDVVVEVFGIPECEESSGTVYFHRLDFRAPVSETFSKISSLKTPSAKL